MDEAVGFMEREDATEQDQLGSKYLLGEQLGRGAMGVVFAGSTRDGEELAVKILRPELSSDAKTVSRFIQERHIFSRVNHPNVVRVHDLVAEGDRLGIVMERVSGGDLKARIDAGTIAPTQAVRIAASVADGLQAIHDVDVIHRDLKPANILLTTDADGGLMPKISDFGISRLVSEAMTRTSTTIGTPLYMAPESADQRGAGNASDVYALGAMLFEMLTGKPPFHEGGTFAVLRAHALDTPARVDGIPPRLTDLIDAMLAKEPASRPSVQATRELLLSVLPEMDDSQQPIAIAVAGAAGAAAAGAAGIADTSGGVGDSSETVVAAPGPNDSSETIVAGTANPGDSSETIVAGAVGAAAVGAAGPSDSSETIVADLQTAATGPAAGGTGPNDSSETVVSSTMFGAAAGAAAAAPINPAPPVAPAPPAMPGGQASQIAGVATAPALGTNAAQTGGGVGGGGPIGTSDRAFDRVPRRVIEVGAVLASMAAVALIAFFVLNGGDGGTGDDVAAGNTLAGDSDIDPESGGLDQDQSSEDSQIARSEFGNADSDDADADGESGESTGTTAASDSDSDANAGSDDGDNNSTDGTTATTEAPEATTTTTEPTTTTTEEEEVTPTTEPPTTEPPVTEPPVTEPPVTEPPVTEPPVTEPPVTIGPITTPIAIVGGVSINSVGSTSFQFTYNTNNVCGSGSFNVVRQSDGVSVGSFGGDGSCYGPLHGGFPGAGAFAGINIEPNTAYTVNITVYGVDGSSGSLSPGSGSASRSFSVTTKP